MAAIAIAAGAAGALAQESGKVKLDVPFVPTPPQVVDRMLEMAQVKATDFVMDLGSGDGRIAIAAAKKYGARALGVDIDPDRITEATANAKTAGVQDKVTFRRQNLFDTKIGEASVLTMYLLTDVNLQLRPRILDELKPGTRVVSHAFDLGDWKPDQQANVDGRQVFFWVVPAKVAGRWEIKDGNSNIAVRLDQKYQTIQGTADIGGKTAPLKAATLNGTEISFTVDGGKTYRGRVDGNRIVPVGGDKWSATRAAS